MGWPGVLERFSEYGYPFAFVDIVYVALPRLYSDEVVLFAVMSVLWLPV